MFVSNAFPHLLKLVFNFLQVNKKYAPISMHPIFKHKQDALHNYKASNYDLALENYTQAIKTGEALIKSKIDFYDLQTDDDIKFDINYEMALINYNISLIHARKYNHVNVVNACQEAFKWLDKASKELKSSNENIEKIRGFVNNKYYIALLKIGHFNQFLYECNMENVTKEVDTMYRKLKCPQFDIFFKELGVTSNDEYRMIDMIMGTDESIDFKNTDVLFTNRMFSNVLNCFITNRNLPGSMLLSILRSGFKAMVNHDNAVYVESNNAYIFGDTHGQFMDTLCFLSMIPGNTFDMKNGLVIDKNSVFIFNGDFVDRGPQGIENFIMLLLLKIMYPDQIYLNRGNHEFESVNMQFGFFLEIYRKYNYIFRTIFNAFETTFMALPLCTILNNDFFIVHGGLPIYTNIKQIQLKDRFTKDFSDNIITGLMWSDPGEIDNYKQNMRGAGIVFGTNVTNTFLEGDKLKKIVRSHEFVDGGYRENHAKKVLTIFSAPNYCGAKNRASYLKVNNGVVSVVQFGEWSENIQFKMVVDKIDQCEL